MAVERQRNIFWKKPLQLPTPHIKLHLKIHNHKIRWIRKRKIFFFFFWIIFSPFQKKFLRFPYLLDFFYHSTLKRTRTEARREKKSLKSIKITQRKINFHSSREEKYLKMLEKMFVFNLKFSIQFFSFPLQCGFFFGCRRWLGIKLNG